MEPKHEEHGGVRSDGKETGVPQRDLPGIAHQQVEADGNEDVDSNQVGKIDLAGKEEGESDHPGDQNEEPDPLHMGPEELDVLIVLPLHIHDATAWPIIRGSARLSTF